MVRIIRFATYDDAQVHAPISGWNALMTDEFDHVFDPVATTGGRRRRVTAEGRSAGVARPPGAPEPPHWTSPLAPSTHFEHQNSPAIVFIAGLFALPFCGASRPLRAPWPDAAGAGVL